MLISASAVSGLRRLRLISYTPLSPIGTAEETRISAPFGTGSRFAGKPGARVPTVEYGGGAVGRRVSLGLEARVSSCALALEAGSCSVCTVLNAAGAAPAASLAPLCSHAVRVPAPTKARKVIPTTRPAQDGADGAFRTGQR